MGGANKEEVVNSIKEETTSTPTVQHQHDKSNSDEVLTESSPKESSIVKNELSAESPRGLETMNRYLSSAEVRAEDDNKK